ncbi:MAG: hypothetical protein ABEI86_04645 [Halobacteriaceae archaeon]
MSLPRTTKNDIVDDEPIDIVVKIQRKQEYEDGNTHYQIEDITGEVFKLKVWAGDLDEELDVDKWYHLKDARGDIYRGETNLASNYGNIQIESLPEPPEFAGDLESESANAHSSTPTGGGIVAFDIETVSTVPESDLDFDNPDHFELLTIGVGFAPEHDVQPESDVLFRDGFSEQAERELLDEFATYIESKNPDLLLTFGGGFDRSQLLGRAARVDTEDGSVQERIESIFDTHELNDIDRLGTLEDNADVPKTYWDIYNHSLQPSEWRQSHPRWDDDTDLDHPEVTNKDISYFGEKYLELCDMDTRNNDQEIEFRALEELIRRYTVTDVIPLFGLM